MKKNVLVLMFVTVLLSLVFSVSAARAAPTFAPVPTPSVTPIVPTMDSLYLCATSNPGPHIDSICRIDSAYVIWRSTHATGTYLHTPGLGTVGEIPNGFLRVDLVNATDTFWVVAYRTTFSSGGVITTYSDTLHLIINTVNCGASIMYITSSAPSGCVGDTMQVSWRANAVRYYLDGTYVSDSGTSAFVIAPGVNTVSLSADGSTDTATASVNFTGYHCDSALLASVRDSASGQCIGTDSVTFTVTDTNAVWRTITTPSGIDTLVGVSATQPILATAWTYTLTVGGPYNSMSQLVFVPAGMHCDTANIVSATDTVNDTCVGSGSVTISYVATDAVSVTLLTPLGTFSVPSDTTLPLLDPSWDYVLTATGLYGNIVTTSLPVDGSYCLLPDITAFTGTVTGTCIGSDSVTITIETSNATSVSLTTPTGTITFTSDTVFRQAIAGTSNLYAVTATNPYGPSGVSVLSVSGIYCDTTHVIGIAGPSAVCMGDSATLVFHVANDTALKIVSSTGTLVLSPGDTTARVAITTSVNTFTLVATGEHNASYGFVTVDGAHCYDTAIIISFIDSTGGTCIGTDSAKLIFHVLNAELLTLNTPMGGIAIPPSDTSVMVLLTDLLGGYTLTASTPYNITSSSLTIAAHHCDTAVVVGFGSSYTGTGCIGYDSIKLSIDVVNSTSVTVTSSDGISITYTTSVTTLSDTSFMFLITGPSVTYTVTAYGLYNEYTRTLNLDDGTVCPPAAIDLFTDTVLNDCTDSGLVAIYIHVSNDTAVTLETPAGTLVLMGDTTLYLSFTSLVNAYTLTVSGAHNSLSQTLTVFGTDCDTMHFLTVTFPDTLCVDSAFSSSWTTNAPASVSVDTSAVNFSVPGTYGIWFIATGTHNDDSVHETIVIKNCDTSGDTDTTAAVQAVPVRVQSAAYPSPFTTILTVSSDQPIGSITVMNMVGQKIYASTTNEKQLQIATDDWPRGIYLVRLQNNEVFKVVKK